MSEQSTYLAGAAQLDDQLLEVFWAVDEHGQEIDPTAEQQQGFSSLIDETARSIRYRRDSWIREHGQFPLDPPAIDELDE